MQIIHKKQTNMKLKTFLILQYSTLKSTVVQYTAERGWHRVNGQEELLTGGERRRETAELRDGQRQETEGQLQGQAHLACVAQVLTPARTRRTFASLKSATWRLVCSRLTVMHRGVGRGD